MPCTIRNPNPQDATLPAPFRGCVKQGDVVIINRTAVSALALAGGVALFGSLEVRDAPTYTGAFNTANDIATLYGTSVGVGTTAPVASAAIEVISTTQGVLFPRMTTAQKNAIAAPAEGLVVYDITLHKLCVRAAAAWETITSV